jgi:MFS-type transporter involved in bile tolerance (Atg22 family)
VVSPTSAYSLAAALFLLASIAIGLAQIFWSAFLPLLARQSWKVLASHNQLPDAEWEIQRYEVVSELGSFATIYGFLGSLVALLLSVALLAILASFSDSSPAFAPFNTTLNFTAPSCNVTGAIVYPTVGELVGLYSVLTLAGLFLFVFCLPAFLLLQPRPGRPAPSSWLLIGVKTISKVVFRAKKLPHTFAFLASYALISTGIQTMGFSAGILFSQYLEMSETLLGVSVVISFIAGGVSSFGFLYIQKRWPAVFRAKYVIFCCVVSAR